MASTKPANTLPLGDWQARVRLDEDGKPFALYLDPAGKEHKRLPVAARKAATRAQHDALQQRLKDISLAQKEARRRLEATWRNDRDWSFADWAKRYRDHPLTRVMSSRLIWSFAAPGEPARLALGTAPELTSLDGTPLSVDEATTRVALWHPADTPPEVARAWREALLECGIRQPLWQAWRPVYALTDPERQTATYSNRFAGLLLTQPVFVRVLRNRSWVLKSRMFGDHRDKRTRPARLDLPGAGLVAEFRGAGAGQSQASDHDYSAPNYEHFATSQLLFYRTGEDSMEGARPVPLDTVPIRAFCEAMFDVEVATGLSAIGLDTRWRDPGPDARPILRNRDLGYDGFSDDLTTHSPTALARLRVELLEWLIPRLTIAEGLSLKGHMLRVEGRWHDYEINCGNGAIRIADSKRHVCIVPGGTSGAVAGLVLPFAGDELLAVILSKAHLLVDEETIGDPTIIAQLEPGRRGS
ncbi:DUF4132 domain-containing protein [Sphingomicrobium arenosum]|uniref:DUF4132 domain-containing protein n=1 Tax=Sphingomicrobium arenosum TaxID=2233861 RepID=UPI0022401A95|nr:DUF4132 domain-containing protein [Sphingomicrobium arenosum]